MLAAEVERTDGAVSEALQRLYAAIGKRDRAEAEAPIYVSFTDVRCNKCGAKVASVDHEWSEHQLECEGAGQ